MLGESVSSAGNRQEVMAKSKGWVLVETLRRRNVKSVVGSKRVVYLVWSANDVIDGMYMLVTFSVT